MRTPGQHEQPELLWYRRASWRRAGGVLLGVGVLALTALMLGRVVVARVPQQRAVIERLFEQRTGLEVRFASIDEQEIAAYIATGEPFGKAGAYAIQGRGATFVAHLSGSFSAVMGLPLHETAGLLRGFGFAV